MIKCWRKKGRVEDRNIPEHRSANSKDVTETGIIKDLSLLDFRVTKIKKVWGWGGEPGERNGW